MINFVDLKLSDDFSDFDSLDENSRYLMNFDENKMLLWRNEGKNNIFRRLDLDEKDLKLNLRKDYDLLAVHVTKMTARIRKFGVDVIYFDLDQVKHLKKAVINTCKENNIFIEIKISEGIEDEVEFMRALRRLLTYGSASVLVISSGASYKNELRGKSDVESLLKNIGVRKNQIQKIMDNPKRCLRLAALKKHSFKDCITNDVGLDDLFKKEFIWEYHKN